MAKKQNKENETETVKSTEMDSFLSVIQAAFGKKSDIFVKDPNNIDLERFSTGSYLLDRDLKGGWVKGTMIEIYGNESSGKAQPLSAKILTPDGWINMGDVQEGTVVCTPDGDTSPVTGIFPQGEQDVYEVTLDDNSKTRCTLDHLWYIEKRSAKKNVNELKTLGEIIDSGLTSKIKTPTYKYRIPSIEVVNFNKKDITVDPYLLGVLLGDGNLGKTTVVFTTVDDFILQKITKIVERDYPELSVKPVSSVKDGISYRISNNKDSYGAVGSVKNRLLEQLREINCANKVSYEKEIPEHYLYNTTSVRLALLQGLMDSDGSIGTNSSVGFSSTSKKMAEQVVEIMRSLGYRASMYSRVTQYRKPDGTRVDGRESYNVSVCVHDNSIECFSLPRKVERMPINNSNYAKRYITKIEKVGREECQCIMIGHPDHLYITDDYIVTHNTTLAIHSAAEHQKAYPNEKVLWIDLEKVFDPVYFKTIGLNIEPENFLLARPNTGEEAWQIMIEFTKAFQNGLIVLDSVALLLPEKEEEMLMTENSFAQAARMNSLGLRKLFPHVKMGGTTIIALNQVREDIGAYGDSDKSTGGNGWKFYARTRLKTSKSKGEAGEYAVHKYRQIKSNYGTPDAITETTINYGEGFNKVKEFIKVCLAEGLIQRAGSWFSYGDVKLGQGENAVVEILQDNPELFDELFKKLKDLKVL